MLTVVFPPYDADLSMDKVSQFVETCDGIQHLLDDTHCLVFPSVHALKLAMYTHVVDFAETAVIKDHAHALLVFDALFKNKKCFSFSIAPKEKDLQPTLVAVTILLEA